MYLFLKKKFLFNVLKIFDIFFMLSALAMSLSFWGFPQVPSSSIWELLYIKTKFVNVVLLLIFMLIWRLIFHFLGLYDSTRLGKGKGKTEGETIVLAVLIGSMVFLAMTVLFQRNI